MMYRRPGIPGSLVLALLLSSVFFALAADVKKCMVCGMVVDEKSPFSGKVVEGNRVQHFCDLGELLLYIKEGRSSPSHALVKDYRTGTEIIASKAYYVRAPKRFVTPMGWSIASFKDRKEAEEFGIPFDGENILKQLP